MKAHIQSTLNAIENVTYGSSSRQDQLIHVHVPIPKGAAGPYSSLIKIKSALTKGIKAATGGVEEITRRK